MTDTEIKMGLDEALAKRFPVFGRPYEIQRYGGGLWVNNLAGSLQTADELLDWLIERARVMK